MTGRKYLDLLKRGVEIQRAHGISKTASRTFDALRSKLRTHVQQYRYELFAEDSVTQTYSSQGVVFSTPTFESYARITHDEIEQIVISKIVDRFTADDVFFDIGANIGQFSCIVGAATPAKKVVAFEPHPANVRLLSRNLEANRVDAIVMDCALSDASGEGELHILNSAEAGSQEHTLSDNSYHQNSHAVRSAPVALRTGDELIAAGECPPPTILKIDVEGAGPQAIRGLSNALSRDECRLILVEPHHNTAEIKSLLEGYGFTMDTVDGTGNEPTLVGQK